MKKFVLKEGFICDPANGLEGIADLVIYGDKIQEIIYKTKGTWSDDFEVVDAKGLIVMPGFIDLHTHLRDPGFVWKEDIKSGAVAASRGGFTTICAMPNTNPPPDSAPLVRDFVQKVADAPIRIFPIGTITKNRSGNNLSPMMALCEAGVVGFSDDGDPIMDPKLMRQALLYSIDTGLPIINHAEDMNLKGTGVMNTGAVADRLGLNGVLPSSEYLMVQRDIELALSTGGKIHVPHVSTRQSVSYIKEAKSNGVNVSAEVTPQHLTMNENWVYGLHGDVPEYLTVDAYETNAKVNPPLRSQDDVEALIQGLNEGIIDIVATDHAPHSLADKQCSFDQAEAGINNIETAFCQLFELVERKKITLGTLVSSMTEKPAKIIDKNFGTLSKNSIADVTVFNPNISWLVHPKNLASKSSNTPLLGQKLKGRIVLTLANGKVIHNELF